MSFITSYCHINELSCWVNGTQLLAVGEEGLLLRELYDFMKLDYPKFHKMDKMSKVGVLGSELLLQANKGLKKYQDDQITLVFSNQNGSADADLNFQKSYQGETPSPSLFIYTLPNILIGEITIRNKWFGEHLCAVHQAFTPEFYLDYCELIMKNKAEACLCGWVTIEGDKIDGFIFTVEKEDLSAQKMQFTLKNLTKLRLN